MTAPDFAEIAERLLPCEATVGPCVKYGYYVPCGNCQLRPSVAAELRKTWNAAIGACQVVVEDATVYADIYQRILALRVGEK